jgi:hypothetical protein
VEEIFDDQQRSAETMIAPVRVAILLCMMSIAASAAPTTAPTTGPTTDAAKYPVRFKSDRAGQRYDATITVGYERERNGTRDGKSTWQQTEAFTLDLDGTVEVLEARDGDATKQAITVERFDRTEGINREAVVPPGSVIIVERGERSSKYSLKSGEIDPKKLRFVEMISQLRSEDEPSEDETYGPGAPQPVGASWPVNAARFARSLSSSFVAKPESVMGTVRLIAVEQNQARTCLHVEAEASASDVRLASLAKEWKQTVGNVHTGFALLLPMDESEPIGGGSAFYEVNLSFLRYVGPRQAQRETSRDHVKQYRQVKVRRIYPATKPS